LSLHGLIGDYTRTAFFQYFNKQKGYAIDNTYDIFSVLFPKFELVGKEWITFDKKIQNNDFTTNRSNNDNDNNNNYDDNDNDDSRNNNGGNGSNNNNDDDNDNDNGSSNNNNDNDNDNNNNDIDNDTNNNNNNNSNNNDNDDDSDNNNNDGDNDHNDDNNDENNIKNDRKNHNNNNNNNNSNNDNNSENYNDPSETQADISKSPSSFPYFPRFHFDFVRYQIQFSDMLDIIRDIISQQIDCSDEMRNLQEKSIVIFVKETEKKLNDEKMDITIAILRQKKNNWFKTENGYYRSFPLLCWENDKFS
jgi:hypothetical protein